MDIRQRAKELLLGNYAQTGGKYIAPDGFHKDQWFWDSCFHAISCADLGLNNLAKNEIERLLRWQKADGWIPQQIYRSKKRWWLDFERPLYKKGDNLNHSSITNPPVLAQAVEAINDPEWTQKVLPAVIKLCLYFSKKQDPDGDGLVSVCHPCESGMDTSPEFDGFRGRIDWKRLSPLNQMLFRYFLFKLEWNYKKVNWDIAKMWQADIFNVENLMVHCVWVENLRCLLRLISAYGSEDISREFGGLEIIKTHIQGLADRGEKAVYDLCWDKNDRAFYGLDSKNRKIKRLTVSNLFPLILDNIPREMHSALVEHLTNPEEFWTPYPIPSVAKSDSAFDPGRDFYCNWRGPVWINMNWFIIKGLVKHGYMDIAKEIAGKTQAMVEREGFREFYNPLNGRGLREPTRGFGWSTLAITFPKIIGEK